MVFCVVEKRRNDISWEKQPLKLHSRQLEYCRVLFEMLTEFRNLHSNFHFTKVRSTKKALNSGLVQNITATTSTKDLADNYGE